MTRALQATAIIAGFAVACIAVPPVIVWWLRFVIGPDLHGARWWQLALVVAPFGLAALAILRVKVPEGGDRTEVDYEKLRTSAKAHFDAQFSKENILSAMEIARKGHDLPAFAAQMAFQKMLELTEENERLKDFYALQAPKTPGADQ